MSATSQDNRFSIFATDRSLEDWYKEFCEPPTGSLIDGDRVDYQDGPTSSRAENVTKHSRDSLNNWFYLSHCSAPNRTRGKDTLTAGYC